MMSIKPKTDFNHYSLYNFFIRALTVDNAVTSNTMLILLAGIKIAATMGDKMPRTANDKPTILYNIERTKLAVTMLLPDLAKAINLSSNFTFAPSRIASQAGENCEVLSLTAIPTLLCIKAPASFNPSPNINTFLLLIPGEEITDF